MNERKTDSRGSGKNGASRFRRWFRAETISLAELGVQTFAVVLGILLAQVLAVPSRETPRIQECHMLMGHALCQAVEQALFPPA